MTSSPTRSSHFWMHKLFVLCCKNPIICMNWYILPIWNEVILRGILYLQSYCIFFGLRSCDVAMNLLKYVNMAYSNILYKTWEPLPPGIRSAPFRTDFTSWLRRPQTQTQERTIRIARYDRRARTQLKRLMFWGDDKHVCIYRAPENASTSGAICFPNISLQGCWMRLH